VPLPVEGGQARRDAVGGGEFPGEHDRVLH
jgi:hypothetical protein